MKKWIQILLIITIICYCLGFYFFTISPNHVFIGIFFIVIGALSALCSIFPARKMLQEQNKQKEDQLKRIEEDIAQIKAELLSK